MDRSSLRKRDSHYLSGGIQVTHAHALCVCVCVLWTAVPDWHPSCFWQLGWSGSNPLVLIKEARHPHTHPLMKHWRWGGTLCNRCATGTKTYLSSHTAEWTVSVQREWRKCACVYVCRQWKRERKYVNFGESQLIIFLFTVPGIKTTYINLVGGDMIPIKHSVLYE